MIGHDEHAEFDDFVRANWATLMSIARAVSSSSAEAEDLLQTALTSVYARWGRVRTPDRLPYLRRTILNANVSRWRRHRGRELPFAELPDVGAAAATDGVEDQLVLVPLLRALPARQRAVLVLRYLCDLPDDQIADTLGISPGTVRSQAARGLAGLRARTTAPSGADPEPGPALTTIPTVRSTEL
jgi:RNA polymerase sigma-70 factor (sigma-E family)